MQRSPITIRRPALRACALAAMLAGGLAGCGHGPTAPLSELAVARARWRHARPIAYQFTLTRSCYCMPESTGPVVIVVSGETVTSRSYAATGEPVAPAYQPLFPAVEGLFAIIEDAIARKTASLDVDYDPVYGYPTRISIDYIAQAADDEITYVVRDWRSRELRTGAVVTR